MHCTFLWLSSCCDEAMNGSCSRSDQPDTHKRLRGSPGSLSQVSAPRAAIQLSSLSQDSLLLILRAVGAHNLQAIWPCKECDPYWYDWYCHKCEKSNYYLYWSPSQHHGHCGQSCPCCRSELAEEFGGCGSCDDLLSIQATCRSMRDLLKTYDGR